MDLTTSSVSHSPPLQTQSNMRNIYADPALSFIYMLIDSQTANTIEAITEKLASFASTEYISELLISLEEEGYIIFNNGSYLAKTRGIQWDVQKDSTDNVFPKFFHAACKRVLKDVKDDSYLKKGESFRLYYLPEHPTIKARCQAALAVFHKEIRAIQFDSLSLESQGLRVVAIASALPEAEDIL